MLNIRIASDKDALAIHEIGRSVPEFVVNAETINFWPMEILTAALKSEDILVLVAEDTEIRGFLIAQLSSGLSKATIENIYVMPEFRDKGVGDSLIEQLLKELSVRNYAYIATLIPLNATSALKLYTRAGFSEGEKFIWLDKSLSEKFDSTG